MSDKNKANSPPEEGWKPLDLKSLQHIEEERFMKTDKTTPDYALFKRIYEDTEISGSEAFKPLYEFDGDGNIPGEDGDPEFEGLLSGQGIPAASRNCAPGPKDNTAPGNDTAAKSENIDKHIHRDGDITDTRQPVSELQQNINNGFEEGFEKGKEEGVKEGRATGEKQGYADGYEKGDSEARKSCDVKSLETLASLEDILLKTNDAWTALVKKYENEILSLVCKIAEKVVLAKVEIDDGLVKESIFYALEKIPEPEEITLHVSPDDYEYIEMIKEDFFEKTKGITSVSVVSDHSINRGGCRIDNSKAKIETDIESRLKAVFESIAKAGVL